MEFHCGSNVWFMWIECFEISLHTLKNVQCWHCCRGPPPPPPPCYYLIDFFPFISLSNIPSLCSQPKIAQGNNEAELVTTEWVWFDIRKVIFVAHVFYASCLSRFTIAFLKMSIQRWINHIALSQGPQNKLGKHNGRVFS